MFRSLIFLQTHVWTKSPGLNHCLFLSVSWQMEDTQPRRMFLFLEGERPWLWWSDYVSLSNFGLQINPVNTTQPVQTPVQHFPGRKGMKVAEEGDLTAQVWLRLVTHGNNVSTRETEEGLLQVCLLDVYTVISRRATAT